MAPGSQLYETQTGTLGYEVMLECPDGSTSFVIWLTQKNRDCARRYFEVLGIDLNAVFEKMTSEELERYAKEGTLPEWFEGVTGATPQDCAEDRSNG